MRYARGCRRGGNTAGLTYKRADRQGTQETNRQADRQTGRGRALLTTDAQGSPSGLPLGALFAHLSRSSAPPSPPPPSVPPPPPPLPALCASSCATMISLCLPSSCSRLTYVPFFVVVSLLPLGRKRPSAGRDCHRAVIPPGCTTSVVASRRAIPPGSSFVRSSPLALSLQG